jgi:hypothetical protein
LFAMGITSMLLLLYSVTAVFSSVTVDYDNNAPVWPVNDDDGDAFVCW